MIALLAILGAHAGSFDGMVSADAYSASSTSTELNSGPEKRLSANELGMRLRARLFEKDGRLKAEVDYRGREPIGGDLQNRNLRLLYRTYLQYEVVEDKWTLGGGRFMTDSVILLPVDGVFTEIEFDRRMSLTVFGGRRGFSTSLRNLPLDTLLPAAGVSFHRYRDKLQITAQAVYAQDQFVIPLDDVEEENTANYGASNGSVGVVGLPKEELVLGARVNFAEQMSYELGPTWLDLNSVSAFGLWSAIAFADYNVSDHVQLDYDFHRQTVGIVADDGRAELIDPNWMDNRVSANFAPGDLGWVRTMFRYRTRASWQEQRYTLQLDANKLGLEGLYARANGSFDNIANSPVAEEAGLVDHLFWSAALGYKRGGFDARAGASFFERTAAPVSSRRMDITDPQTSSEDLQPFVLAAQNIAFVRSFYSGKKWFSGVDFEKNLQDPEIRVMIQVGALTEKIW